MEASESFKIPVARDADGRLVTPEHAKPRGIFRCPACDARVDLHAGEKKRRHFHHRTSTCTAESVLHLCAKQLIAQSVEEWLAGGPPVRFARSCAHGDCDAMTSQSIPSKVKAVRIEHVMPSGHVADIALLATGRARGAADAAVLPLPVAVIEVHHTHAVDAIKARELGVPWVEVDAAAVCAAAGRDLVVTTDRFLPWFCEEHASSRGAAKKMTQIERGAAAALARKLPFRLSDFPAYRVVGVSTCPVGHDALVFGWEGRDPPWPRPPLVIAVPHDFDWTMRGAARRPTKTAAFRRSYASACPTCGEAVRA